MSRATDNEHFDNLANRYEKYRSLDKEPIEYLVERLPLTEVAICELGCGTGRYLSALVDQFAEKGSLITAAVGVDPSQRSLAAAQQNHAKAGTPITWRAGTSDKTGLMANRTSLVTSFNSIHHLPIASTLREIERISQDTALFAVYTRVREQEREHVWGQWFPAYLDHTVVPSREFVSGFAKINSRFRLVWSHDFTFTRRTTFSWICEQTQSKFYSTLSRYSDQEFDLAYATFVKNLESAYQDVDPISYPSSYSLFLYQIENSAVG